MPSYQIRARNIFKCVLSGKLSLLRLCMLFFSEKKKKKGGGLKCLTNGKSYEIICITAKFCFFFFFYLNKYLVKSFESNSEFKRNCAFLKCSFFSQILNFLHCLLAHTVYFWSSSSLKISPIIFWCINNFLIFQHPPLLIWWIECMTAVPRGRPENKMLQLMSLLKWITENIA